MVTYRCCNNYTGKVGGGRTKVGVDEARWCHQAVTNGTDIVSAWGVFISIVPFLVVYTPQSPSSLPQPASLPASQVYDMAWPMNADAVLRVRGMYILSLLAPDRPFCVWQNAGTECRAKCEAIAGEGSTTPLFAPSLSLIQSLIIQLSQ